MQWPPNCSEKSRSQIVRVDQMVSDLVEKVESTADSVQKGVLGPVNGVSAVARACVPAWSFVTRRRVTNQRSDPGRAALYLTSRSRAHGAVMETVR